jgi:hypothetical protein
MTFAALGEAARAAGLSLRGGFRLGEAERTGPLADVRVVAMLGFVGREGWPAFAASPEAADGLAHPLDRWSRRVASDLAERFGAKALFPFEGPPYMPFQAWGARAEPLFPSPLGMFIHPRYGLWHSFRAALALAEEIDPPRRDDGESPCRTCAERPCLSACPVGAFTAAGYDVAACAGFLRAPGGAACMEGGCLARRACPVGRDFAQTASQAAFHIRAFLAARG